MPASGDINYQGPSQNYESYPDSGGPSITDGPRGGVGLGYADIDFLIENLELFSKDIKRFYDLCVLEMNDFTLLLDTSDSILVNSHNMSYPDDETPGSISFNEYIYNFATSKSTSSRYVNNYYENKVRGIYGTNALDIAHISRVTYLEIKRIQNFLDSYTGEINEPSEYRVIEVFQDWLQNAASLFQGFREAFETKAIVKIPESELAEIDQGKSKEFQALFQSKLNVINRSISDIVGQLYKDYDGSSDFFYNKVLGPSLSFNLKVSKNITGGLDLEKTPLLLQEAQASVVGLTNQFKSALGDQVKRNNLYYSYLNSILNNVLQRDAYVNYLEQLSQKGTILPRPFVSQIAVEPEILRIETNLENRNSLDYSVNASSDHENITNREKEDAHPQYLLRKGGIIDGRVDINGDLFLNEANLANVIYSKNGVAKVSSEAIDWDSVSNSDTNSAGDSSIPSDLQIIGAEILPDGSVRYTINFDIDEDTATNYEFEIIEL
jgi:hypothetical protein